MRLSLLVLGRLWVLFAFVAGVVSAALWFHSEMRWEQHLTKAQSAGFATYEALVNRGTPPNGIRIATLTQEQSALAEAGRFSQIFTEFRPAYLTQLSLGQDRPKPSTLRLVLVSPDLKYPVAELGDGDTLGHVTQMLANYCSRPVILAQLGDEAWLRIDTDQFWNCAAAPKDLRLWAVLSAILALIALLTHVGATTDSFGALASALGARHSIDAPDTYNSHGPHELTDIVSAINAHLEAERKRLEKRTEVLSGISHDLGTPATRLRLRAALIEDETLRAKFEGDIDQMTDMIESVLTYTQSELPAEKPRQIALSSLLEAIVSDYQDIGQPVYFKPIEAQTIDKSASVFGSALSQRELPETRRVLSMARPLLLRRALTNLIDNALKYGRSATVSLRAQSDLAEIIICDEGSTLPRDQIRDLVAPFKRGPNADQTNGLGLGLTIVSTIAEQHGGTLSFCERTNGLCACLTISRSFFKVTAPNLKQ